MLFKNLSCQKKKLQLVQAEVELAILLLLPELGGQTRRREAGAQITVMTTLTSLRSVSCATFI